MKALFIGIVSIVFLGNGMFGQNTPHFSNSKVNYENLDGASLLFENKQMVQGVSTQMTLPFEIKGCEASYNRIELHTSYIDFFDEDRLRQLLIFPFINTNGSFSTTADSSTTIKLKKSGSAPNRIWVFEFNNIIFEELPGEHWSKRMVLDEARNSVAIHFGPNDVSDTHPLKVTKYRMAVGEIQEGTPPDNVWSLKGDPASPTLENNITDLLDQRPELERYYEFGFCQVSSISEKSTVNQLAIFQDENEICFSSQRNTLTAFKMFNLEGKLLANSRQTKSLCTELRRGVYIGEFEMDNGFVIRQKIFKN
ncbi:MAG: hypothetical protein ACI9YL_001538 [Luteibaculaceae bacterium]|jgi:hypothetical protein